MILRLIVDPTTHCEYTLKSGKKFVIDNYRDTILKDGYYHQPPKKKNLWKRTVKDLIDNEFKGNIKEASEVLYEVYQRPEYLRGNLYKYIYTRQREDRRNKKLKKLMEYIYREGLVEEVKKELWKKESVGIESEQLGSSQCDFQLKKFKHVNSMEKCQRC